MSSTTEPRPSSIASSTPTAANSPRAPDFSKSPLAGDPEKGAIGANVEDVDDYPDGGLRAWLVVLGVSLPSLHPLDDVRY